VGFGILGVTLYNKSAGTQLDLMIIVCSSLIFTINNENSFLHKLNSRVYIAIAFSKQN